MSNNQQDRRNFLKTSAAAAAVGSAPFWFPVSSANAFNYKSSNERPVLGCIGTGSRWGAVGPAAMRYSDCVAVCDADAVHAARGKDRVLKAQGKKGKEQQIDVVGDYRRILDRKDVDIVTIVTPDHWHSKIAIEAMQAGKDVYCEKPLTLTINEGKQIVKVLKETKRVFQVGTQQRTEMGKRFLQAIAMVRDGRIGKLKRVTCAIGGSRPSGPLKVEPVPEGLDWDMWQGQTPTTEYRKRRCHYEFRWWYEYSGGKLTDWGAHHVDIAQWAMGQNGEGQGPLSIDPVSVTHPVPFKNGNPTDDTQYNAATAFMVSCQFPNDVELRIRHDTDNGIMFEGSIEGPRGRFFVNRGKIVGAPVEALKDKPLPADAISKVYGGEVPRSHMQNFMDCVKSRELPISDVFTHHRALTTCHLSNIALRLNRKLTWNSKTEQIEGDSEANQMQGREQRKGFEIDVSV